MTQKHPRGRLGIALAAIAVAAVLLAVVQRPQQSPPAEAAFHLAVMDELMSGVGGDPAIQYVEIKMLQAGQNLVTNARVTVFPGDGTHTVLLVVPNDVASGANRTWIVAANNSTISGDEFMAASGIAADFTFDPSTTAPIPGSGMLCWGAPGSIPPAPGSWNPGVPANYTECVAYGGYSGNPAVPSLIGSTTTLAPGDGTLALQRTNSVIPGTFALACPSPKNNANQLGGFGPCSPATSTPTPSATATPTPSVTSTPTPTPRGFCIKGTSDGGSYQWRLTLPGVGGSPFTSAVLSQTNGNTAAQFRDQFVSTTNALALTGVTAASAGARSGGWECFTINVAAEAGATGALTFEVTSAGGLVFPGSPVSSCNCMQSFNPVIAAFGVGGVAEQPESATLAAAQGESSGNDARLYGGVAAGLAVLLVAAGGLVVRRRRSQ
ncbi:MAG: hypothetical protein WEC75_03885 [Dehalococcoidia bacterium]